MLLYNFITLWVDYMLLILQTLKWKLRRVKALMQDPPVRNRESQILNLFAGLCTFSVCFTCLYLVHFWGNNAVYISLNGVLIFISVFYIPLDSIYWPSRPISVFLCFAMCWNLLKSQSLGENLKVIFFFQFSNNVVLKISFPHGCSSLNSILDKSYQSQPLFFP